jgi:serine/threonine-protein kinase
MPDDALSAFLRSLQDTELLSPRQWETVDSELRLRCAGVADLARELVRRGWLTRYQANEINRGRGRDLLVGEYLLLDRLSGGGMGQVFKARHRRLDRIEALKVIRDDLLGDPLAARHLVSRFHRELEATARLAHPNIVRVYYAGEDRGRPFMVMEYLEGTDLDRLVQESGPLPVGQACAYVEQTAQGLEHLHERGMVHRDMKPRNLFVTAREQQVKILDLGLVLFLRGDERQDTVEELTRGVGLMGTRPYMAPEQVLNAHAVDIRADLYSLGCTFHFLLTGRPPGPDGDTQAKPLEALRPDVPPGVAAVVRQLLAPRREDRPATPAALAATLAPFLRPRAVAVPVARAVGGAGPGGPSTPPVAVPAAVPPVAEVIATDTRPPAETVNTAPLHPPRAAAGKRGCLVAGVAALVLLGTFLAVGGAGVFVIGWFFLQGGSGGGSVTRGPIAGGAFAPKPPAPPEQPGALGGSRLLVGHTVGVQGIALLPDDRHVLSCSIQEVILWDLTTGAPVKRYSHNDAIMERLRGGFGGVPGGGPGPAGPGGIPKPPAAEDFSPDWPGAVAVAPGGHLALLAGPNSLTLWDLDDWKRRRSFGKMEGGTIHCCVAVSPDGRLALHGDQHDVIRLYDLEKEAEIPGAGWPGHFACFSPDGGRVLVGEATGLVREPMKLRLFDVRTRQKVLEWPAHLAEVTAAAVAPDGRHALSAGGRENEAVLWDLTTGKEVSRFRGHAAPVTSVAFSPDGSRALTGGGDATVRLWEVASAKELGAFKEHSLRVTCVAFSPGGRYALSGSEDKSVGVWELPK